MISIIQQQLADGARRTVVHSCRFDVGSETELPIKVKELLFDDPYLSKVINDKKSWFTQIDVLDFINHQFLFTTNSLGRQPTTSQYFQPLAPQTLALAASAIHCVLSEYACGKKATVKFSQNEYRGTFGLSPVIIFTLGATTELITHQRPHHTPAPPVQGNSTRISCPQSSSELLSLDWTSSISFRNQFLLSALLYSIPHSRSPYPCSTAQDGSSSFPTGAPIMHSTLLIPPLFSAPPLGYALLLWDMHFSIPLVLRCLDWLFCISFRTS